MSVNLTVSSSAPEGGVATITVTSDTAGLTISSNIAFSYTGPQGSGSSSSGGSVATSTSSYSLPFQLYDDGVVGAGSYTLKGTVSVNGVAYTVNTTGTVVDNDSSDFTVNLSNGATAMANLSRTAAPSTDPLHPSLFDSTTYASDRAAIQVLEPALRATTAVAVTAYQFFTGVVPSLAGLDYLINPNQNANSLNSSYYTNFNVENRYYNFASNLGLHGEGASAFAAAYGGLSFHDALVKAYTQIVGGADTVANFSAAISSIESSQSYFQQIAHERLGGDPQDLATKAVMIGYVTEEAVKADVGVYARALENFYLDLADGSAKTGVSLVGTYGAGTFVDTHNG